MQTAISLVSTANSVEPNSWHECFDPGEHLIVLHSFYNIRPNGEDTIPQQGTRASSFSLGESP
jgi:hypothetical protein